MKPTRLSNRISDFYDQPPARPIPRAATVDVTRRRVAEVHRLGGPVAGLAASVVQLCLGVTATAAAASSWLGFPPGVSVEFAVVACGGAIAMSGALSLYAWTVAAAVASTDVEGESKR